MNNRLPSWLKTSGNKTSQTHAIKSILRGRKLHSVCEEAKCPNLCECFLKGTSTFMILGSICTRNCKFCAVAHGIPEIVDLNEPENIAKAVSDLKLRHVVITSVTRDDLADQGAKHFADTIKAVKHNTNATIEVLTPDFRGDLNLLKVVTNEQPDVFNHNIETIKRLTSSIRDKKADFETSLNILKNAKLLLPNKIIKSGFMVGLGETDDEVFEVLNVLKNNNVDLVTIGQYLRPTKNHSVVERYVTPEQFNKYSEYGKTIGLEIFAGPLVRSSYNADKFIKTGV